MSDGWTVRDKRLKWNKAGIDATAGTPVRRFSRDENASTEGIGKYISP